MKLYQQMAAIHQTVASVRKQLKDHGEEIREVAEGLWPEAKYNRFCVLMRNVQTKKPMTLQKDIIQLLDMMQELQAAIESHKGA